MTWQKKDAMEIWAWIEISVTKGAKGGVRKTRKLRFPRKRVCLVDERGAPERSSANDIIRTPFVKPAAPILYVYTHTTFYIRVYSWYKVAHLKRAARHKLPVYCTPF